MSSSSDLSSDILWIVESYFNELNDLGKRANSYDISASIDFTEKKRLKETKHLHNEIDYLLNNFSIIHESHVAEFWDRISEITDAGGIKKIVDTELLEAFKKFQQRAYLAIKRVVNRTQENIELSEFLETKYREIDLENLSKITFESLYQSWVEKKNPVNGTVYGE